jgi:methionyl aminopeptidase
VKDPVAVMVSAAAAKANGNGSAAEAEDSDDEDEKGTPAEGGTEGAAKKKRKRKKKPKSKTGGANPTKQTSPPRVLLSNLFPSGEYPVGQEVEYRDENLYRTTNEEKRHLDRMNNDFLQEYRQGAEIHRQVRQWAAQNIKPGQSLTEIAEGIEDGVRALTGHPGLEEGDNIKGGVAFPTGLNLDHIAAHYSPNAGNKKILTKDHVMKVDFGVHINGRIVDSAFTMSFDPMYDNLLEAVKQGTNTGINEAGIDARMGEIGAAIQETMESYEVEIRGETYPVKCIRNLNGHDIRQWQIHGGKSVPIVKSNDQTKMEEGEVFAIETFGSTGSGYVRDDVSFLRGRGSESLLRESSWKRLIMHCAPMLLLCRCALHLLASFSTSSKRVSEHCHFAGDTWTALAKKSICWGYVF